MVFLKLGISSDSIRKNIQFNVVVVVVLQKYHQP